MAICVYKSRFMQHHTCASTKCAGTTLLTAIYVFMCIWTPSCTATKPLMCIADFSGVNMTPYRQGAVLCTCGGDQAQYIRWQNKLLNTQSVCMTTVGNIEVDANRWGPLSFVASCFNTPSHYDQTLASTLVDSCRWRTQEYNPSEIEAYAFAYFCEPCLESNAKSFHQLMACRKKIYYE